MWRSNTKCCLFLSNRTLPIAGFFTLISCFVIHRTVLMISYQKLTGQELEKPIKLSAASNIEAPINDVKKHCPCTSSSFYLTNKTLEHTSTCSHQSDLRGFNQSVVSYSLFGFPESDPITLKRYFSSIESHAERIAKVYPGWIMRVYHNLTIEQQIAYFCTLNCNYTNVDLCDVNSFRVKGLRSRLIHNLNPRMWRFLVMLDPMVDRFLSRDIDSEIIPRETAAVRQWLRSNYTFHIMRDHPSHGGFMLAGLWGAKNFQRRSLMKHLGTAMIWSSQDSDYQTDQNRLDLVVWPFASFDVMAHDSYFCNTWIIKLGNVVPVFPFPTKRIGRNYTGLDVVRTDIAERIVPCPVECRPKNHKDWIFC